MTIKVESTTVSPEQVLAESKAPVTEKTVPAAAKEVAENVEASGASENESEEDQEQSSADAEGEEENEEEQSDEGKSQDQPKKRKSGFKKRIDKLSQRLSEKDKRISVVEQEKEYWRQEALKGQKPQETKPAPKKELLEDGKPKSEDYESHDAWSEAVVDWKLDQKEIKQKQAQAKNAYESKLQDFQTKLKTLGEETEDFDDLIAGLNDVEVPVAFQQAILDSDNSPLLYLELAKNKEELKRICKLPWSSAIRELGKFEAGIKSLQTSEKKSENKTTKAPAPINPVGGKGAAVTLKSLSDPNLSQREYEALRAKQRSA